VGGGNRTTIGGVDFHAEIKRGQFRGKEKEQSSPLPRKGGKEKKKETIRKILVFVCQN